MLPLKSTKLFEIGPIYVNFLFFYQQVVVHDHPTLTPEILQRFSYKMTHMYYNWPGVLCFFVYLFSSLFELIFFGKW